MLIARIGASFLTKLFRHAYSAASGFEVLEVHGSGDQFQLGSYKFSQ